MISNIALTELFGKPLIMYGGLLTLFLLLFTATVGALNHKGISIIPFKWHPRLALTTITIALAHALLGLSIYFKF